MSCVDVPVPSSPLAHSPTQLVDPGQNGLRFQGGSTPPSQLNPLAGNFNPGNYSHGGKAQGANQNRGRSGGSGRGGLSSAVNRTGGQQHQPPNRQASGDPSGPPAAAPPAAGIAGNGGNSGAAASSSAAAALRPAGGGGGRGGCFANANHLLNFQYESARGASGRGASGRGGNRPASARSGGGGGGYSASTSSARRYAPAKPQKYDKNKFLQANFRFLVSDAVDVSAYEADADKMFDWDDVLQVEMASTVPVQCPISLDSPPLCPQITPCGHVFSFPAIMHHLINHGGEQLRRSAPCPLCFAPVVARELRLVRVRRVVQPRAGDLLTLALIRRTRTSIIPQPVDPVAAAVAAQAAAPCSEGGGGGGEPASLFDRNPFAKFVVGGDASDLWRAASEQLAACAMQLVAEGGADAALEAPYVYGALDQLASRARRWAEHRAECLAARGLLAAREGQAVAPEALGAAAEATVRKMFTAAVSDVTSAREAAAQRSVLDEQFPSLAAAPAVAGGAQRPVGDSGPSTAAAASAPARPAASGLKGLAPSSAPPTAVATGSIAAAAASRTDPVGAAATEPIAGASATGTATAAAEAAAAAADAAPDQPLPFDALFSEDEQEVGHEGQTSRPRREASAYEPLAEANDAAASAAADADADASSPPTYVLAPGSLGSELLGGSSPPSPSGELLGSSPTTTRLNMPGTQGEFYTYQAAGGSWVFLHPLNLRCLLHQHGSYDSCPPVITGRLLELEDVVQSDATRRRWRFLSHLPLSGAFKLCELAMADIAPPESLAPFADELAAREKRRRRQRADERRQAAAEAAAAARAAAARRGPSAEELLAMPSLIEAVGGGGGGSGGGKLVAAAGAAAAALSREMQLSPSEVAESIALQASLEDATAAAPAAGGTAVGGGGGAGVSFARITKMGFAATGPVLGSSPPLGSIAAAVPAPSGAWGARAAGAAAGWPPGSTGTPTPVIASPGPGGAWGSGKGGASIRAAAAGAAVGSKGWGGGGALAAAAAIGAVEGDAGGAGAGGKKNKPGKGTLLFSTGNQRKY